MNNIFPIPLKNHNWSAYSNKKVIIAFNKRSGEVHIIANEMAWLFLSIDAEMTSEEILSEADQTNITLAHYNEAVKFFNQEYSSTLNKYRQEFDYVIQKKIKNNHTYTPEKTFNITIDNTNISISSNSSSVLIDCKEIFKNFISTQKKQKNRFLFEVIVTHSTKKVTVYCNTVILATTAKYSLFMPVLIDHIQNILYQSTDYLLSIHSAALTQGTTALLIPGQSGSGKSTLCLNLIEEGCFQYLSDEISVISNTEKTLLSVPLPASLKKGSWHLFEKRWEHLHDSKIWHREDGRILKYLSLTKYIGTKPIIDQFIIIFPKYKKNCTEIEISKLDAVDALKELTESGYQVKNELTQKKLEAILSWISTAKAFKIQYSNYEQVRQFIDTILK